MKKNVPEDPTVVILAIAGLLLMIATFLAGYSIGQLHPLK